MRIVTCYTPGALLANTLYALRLHWGTTDLVEIDPTDPQAYAKVINRFWNGVEDFAIVEPDIVIRQDVADAFLNCPCPYGAFPYPWLTDIGPALGCTWFRAETQRKVPHAIQEVLNSRVSWKQFDVFLMRHILARDNGLQPHVHLPPVEHLNPHKQLMDGANPEPLMEVPHW